MSFKVSIKDGRVSILCNDIVEETDIEELLGFDESQIEDLYYTHAAIQARWEQIAINLKHDFDLFVEEFEKKWWAHNKRFAKLVLLSYGDTKPTIDLVKDTTIMIYSRDTSDFERKKYAKLAFSSASKKGSLWVGVSEDEFLEEMFKFINSEPAWWYETVLEVSKNMEKNYLTVQNIAKRLDSRSYHMKEVKDLTMAKRSNIGPFFERKLSGTSTF
jgi:hypothetical protein